MQFFFWLTIAGLGAIVLCWLFVFVVKWIVAPVLIHNQQTITAHVNLEVASLEHLTPELRDLMSQVLPQFRAEGFGEPTFVQLRDAMPNVQSVQATLVHPTTHDIAVLIATWTNTLIRSLVFAVRSVFEDGTKIVTVSSRDIGIYPKDPATDSVVFGWVNDAHTLCEAHRRRLVRSSRAKESRFILQPGQEGTYLETEWTTEMQRHMREGYVYLDADKEVYRNTWKGAFLTSWRLTQPLKRWRIKRRDRRARREWKALGMQSYVPPLTASLPQPADAIDPPDASLQYETAIPLGEIHRQSTPGRLRVRIGTASAGQFLAQNWMLILSMCFWLGCVAWIVFLVWKYRVTIAMLRQVPLSRWSWLLPLTILFFALDVWKLIRGLAHARRPIVLTATHEGLQFENLPGWKKNGFFQRSDLEGLQAVRVSIRKTYQLVAVLSSWRQKVLCESSDKEALQRLGDDLAVAMGLRVAEVPVVAAETHSTGEC